MNFIIICITIYLYFHYFHYSIILYFLSSYFSVFFFFLQADSKQPTVREMGVKDVHLLLLPRYVGVRACVPAVTITGDMGINMPTNRLVPRIR